MQVGVHPINPFNSLINNKMTLSDSAESTDRLSSPQGTLRLSIQSNLLLINGLEVDADAVDKSSCLELGQLIFEAS